MNNTYKKSNDIQLHVIYQYIDIKQVYKVYKITIYRHT